MFLGDDDLLEILGQSSREQVIQAHLKKLFSGIHSVKMNKELQHIDAMCSLQGEVVPLSKPVNVNCPVEVKQIIGILMLGIYVSVSIINITGLVKRVSN